MKYPYVDLGFFPIENVSTYVNKSCMVDCPGVNSFDASSTVDPDLKDAFKSYDEKEGSTLFLLPMLTKNVEVFVSFLFMIFFLTLEWFLFFVQF